MATRNLKGLTISIGGDTSNLTDALKEVDGELSSIQTNLRTVNSALRLDPGNVNALAERQSLLNDAVETTTQRLETLREAQQQVDRQIADGVEVDEQAYRALRSEIIRAEASLSDYQSQASDAGDTSADAAEEASDGWTVVGDVIADLASEAIQLLIQAFGDLMVEAEKAYDLLEARTGASAYEITKYGAVGDKIFREGWGESIADVTEALGTVNQIMGDMDATSLYNITTNAMTLSDVFGWDVSESVRAVSMMMEQFGITADEAFNLIVQGAQNGLDINGDMLDVVNEYSGQFAAAGFSADEMFNMLQNGADAGAWSVDKLGDAVKEYNIRMSDGTAYDALMGNYKALGLTRQEAEALGKAYGEGGEAGAAAMKTTLDAIMSVEDENERYRLGVAMFGTMWEDLGEDAVVALFETEGAIESTNEAMSEVKTDAYDNLARSLTSLGRTLKDALLTPIVELVGPAVKWLADLITNNMSIAQPIIVGLATAFGTLAAALAIKNSISGVTKAFNLLKTTLLANPIFLVVAAIAGLVAAFITAYKNCDKFREIVDKAMAAIWAVVKPIADSIGNALVQAWEFIKAAWEYCAPYFEMIWSNIKIGVEFLKNQLVNVFQTAWNLIKIVWNVVSSYFQAVFDTIAGIFAAAKAVLSGDFQGAWEAIKGIFAGWAEYWQTLIDSVGQIFSVIVEFFRNTFSNVWTAISGVFANWSAYFSGLWGYIESAFSSAIQWFGDIFSGAWAAIVLVWDNVSTYFSDLWSIISDTFSSVGSTLGGFFSDAWSAISEIWSKIPGYFRDYWSNIKATFSVVKDVLSGNFRDAWESIKKVFSGWGKFFSGLWDDIKSTFSKLGTSLSNAIGSSVKAGINGVISWVETTINKAIGLINGAIDVINKVPGVDIGHVGTISIPRLATGGVAKAPMLAEIGEYPGASRNPEIVTPQSILRDTFEESLADFAANGFRDTNSADIDVLATQMRELYSLIGEYLPGIAKNAKKDIYLDKRRLVGELAPDMDDALGEIADRRAVGAV